MNPSEIESLLRRAPQPAAPPGLNDRLLANTPQGLAPRSHLPRAVTGDWIRRWWPTLLAGGGVLACAGVLIQQQGALARRIAEGRVPGPVTETPANVPGSVAMSAAPDSVPMASEQRQEILTLREELAALRAAELEATQLAIANQRLQSELGARSGLTEDDFARLDAARETAMAIRCVNHLKQVGLALRVWATDNNDTYPPDFLTVSRELGTPNLLVCPSDASQATATNWANFNASRISYEFLTPGSPVGETSGGALRVTARCPIHGTILLSDGSVQKPAGDGANITARLVQRDGALWYQPAPPRSPAPPAP